MKKTSFKNRSAIFIVIFVCLLSCMFTLFQTRVYAATEISNKTLTLFVGDSEKLTVVTTETQIIHHDGDYNCRGCGAHFTSQDAVNAHCDLDINCAGAGWTGSPGYDETVEVQVPIKNTSARKVKWKSSKKSVASVSKKGVVKARKVGKATITATIKGKKFQCKVTVISKTQDTGSTTTIDENGSYSSKEDVSLYIHTYNKLPSNFITKSEAGNLGWQGGSLEDFAPGKCIGGDRFGNYEGLLPEGKTYHECDIDTLGSSSRGAKRIVYSDDGYIYYTEDHYGSFEQLYP